MARVHGIIFFPMEGKRLCPLPVLLEGPIAQWASCEEEFDTQSRRLLRSTPIKTRHEREQGARWWGSLFGCFFALVGGPRAEPGTLHPRFSRPQRDGAFSPSRSRGHRCLVVASFRACFFFLSQTAPEGFNPATPFLPRSFSRRARVCAYQRQPEEKKCVRDKERHEACASVSHLIRRKPLWV